MSFLRLSGVDVDAYRPTTFPSLSTRNLLKFHLMSLVSSPPCFCFMNWNSGSAEAPLTSTLAIITPLKPCLLAKPLTSALEPGSCEPNWLHGKKRTSRPFLP